MTDFRITVKNEKGTAVLTAPGGALLADILTENGFFVSSPCGRRGECGKCAVRLINGCFSGVTPDKNGRIKSCRARVCADARIELELTAQTSFTGADSSDLGPPGVCGIAVDLGTTTVAAAFLKPGSPPITASRLNPQAAFGADVISRITAWTEGYSDEMTKRIRVCVRDLIKTLDPDGEAGELAIAGNTVMLHIFCGVSPEKMGKFPFTPEFTQARLLSGAQVDMPVEKVTVLPCASAFIGADVIAGVYALGLAGTEKRVLFADLGTNGELVFSDRGRLFCASTAAGPAFEGACIECGTGSVPGAVNRVYKKNGIVCCSTAGGTLPSGICGAGLTDAVALLLNDGVIDSTGFMEDDFYLSDNVYITPEDIRQFQLAKSAVCSGIETLLDFAGVKKAAVDEIFIAGGLGWYIDPASAVKTGILSGFAPGIIRPAGNTSLKGALMCLASPSAPEVMDGLAKKCTPVDLGGTPGFSARFAANMAFD